MKSITVTSTAFGMNGTIPRQYTGEGKDISPPLAWTGMPEGTRELALICDDPDAPRPEPWVHWVIYRISADTTELPENMPKSERIPPGMLHGKNTWGNSGYGGPMPPQGHGLHHYHFKLYALDMQLSLDPGATKEQLLDTMHGHIIAEGELIGTYQRD